MCCSHSTILRNPCRYDDQDKAADASSVTITAANSKQLTFDAWVEDPKVTPTASILRTLQRALPTQLQRCRWRLALCASPSGVPGLRQDTTASEARAKMSFDFKHQHETPAHSVELFQAQPACSQAIPIQSGLVSFPHWQDTPESVPGSTYACATLGHQIPRRSGSDSPDAGSPETCARSSATTSNQQDKRLHACDLTLSHSPMHDRMLTFPPRRDGAVGCFSSAEGQILVRGESSTSGHSFQVEACQEVQGRWWYDTQYYAPRRSFQKHPP